MSGLKRNRWHSAQGKMRLLGRGDGKGLLLINSVFECRKCRCPRNRYIDRMEIAHLRVQLGIDGELFHSRQEGSAIDAQPRGGSVRPTDTPLAFGKRSHNVVALLPGTLVTNVQSANCFFYNSRNIFLPCRLLRLHWFINMQLAQFTKRRLKLLAARLDHGAFAEVF